MREIWKYEIEWQATLVAVRMPIGAEFRHLAKQNGKTVAWFAVDPKAELEQRWFEWFGTGHQIPLLRIYLGTVLFDELGLVLHLHEVVS